MGSTFWRARYLQLAWCLFSMSVFAEDHAMAGHWPLRDGSGQEVADVSPHQRDGRIRGEVAWVQNGEGALLYFAGGNGRVNVPDTSDLTLGRAMSVEAWVALASKGRTAPIVGKGGQAYRDRHVQLFLGNHGTLWQFSVSDGERPLALSAGAAEVGEWVHLAATWDRTTATARLFKNGVPMSRTRAQVGQVGNDQPVRIGGETNGIHGVISDVKLYTRVLSPDEIRDSFQMGAALKRGLPTELFARATRGQLALNSVGEIICEGTYPGHVQGLDTDGRFIYWSFTTTLVKTDRQGHVVKTMDVPYHHGGITVTGGRLYAAWMPGRKVKVYRTEDLSFLRDIDVPEVRGFPGGMDYHDGCFYIAEGTRHSEFPEVYQYDQNFRHLKTFTVELPLHIGIQTIGRFNGIWWLGTYDGNHPTVVLDDTFKVISTRHDLSTAYGVKDWADDIMLSAVSMSEGEKYRAKALLHQIVGD